MIRANGAAARILAFLNKYIYFIQKIIFKKLQRSIEVKFKVKFGNPKNEAYFKVINFFKFFKFFFFFFLGGGGAKRDFAHNNEKSRDGTGFDQPENAQSFVPTMVVQGIFIRAIKGSYVGEYTFSATRDQCRNRGTCSQFNLLITIVII